MNNFRVRAFKGSEQSSQYQSASNCEHIDSEEEDTPSTSFFKGINMSNKLFEERAVNKEEQLLTQLYELLSCEDVRRDMDDTLRKRVENVLGSVEREKGRYMGNHEEIKVEREKEKDKDKENRKWEHDGQDMKEDKVLFLKKYLEQCNQNGQPDESNDKNDKKAQKSWQKSSQKSRIVQCQTKPNSLLSTKNLSIKVKRTRDNSISQSKLIKKSGSSNKIGKESHSRELNHSKSNKKLHPIMSTKKLSTLNITVKPKNDNCSAKISRNTSKSNLQSKNNNSKSNGVNKGPLTSNTRKVSQQKAKRNITHSKSKNPNTKRKIRIETEIAMEEQKGYKIERLKTEPQAFEDHNHHDYEELNSIIGGCEEMEIDGLYERGLEDNEDESEESNNFLNTGAALEYFSMARTKQKEIMEQQQELQDLTKYLKSQIQSEKQKIEQSEFSIKSISNTLNELDNNSSQTLLRRNDTRKRLEDTWHEVKMLNINIEETVKQNEEVENGVQEEKQLIGMYRQVIEQLKSQLKIEKSERDEMKKKMLIFKKNQEVYKMKSAKAGLKSDGIMEQVKKSLEKWK